MRALRDLPFAWKFNLFVLSISGTVLVLTAGVFIYLYITSTRAEKADELQSLAASAAMNVASALVFEDQTSAEELLNMLKAYPDITIACIYDRRGNVFAVSGGMTSTSDCPKDLSADNRLFFTQTSCTVFQDIVFNNEKAGTLFLSNNLNYIHMAVRRYLVLSSGIMLGALFLISLITNLMQRMVTTPLVRLTEIMKSVARDKNYTVRAKGESRDEIGILIDGFNMMVQEVQTRDETLENKVSVRTAQLETTNKNLENAMKELMAAQELLCNNEVILKAAQKISRIGSFEVDFANRSVFWSDEFFNLLGYTVGEVQPSRDVLLSHIHPDDLPAYKPHIESFDREAAEQQLEFRLITRSSTVRHMRQRDRLEVDSGGNPVKFLGTLQDITDAKAAEEAMRSSLEEKELLLKEVHHRVKNNLATVSALLQLQSLQKNDPYLKDSFQACRDRIQSMALVHNMFYESNNFANIDFKPFVERLINFLMGTYLPPRGVEVELNIDTMLLSLDNAIPCGLIITELFTNAFKYAFPQDGAGRISVECTRENGVCSLRFSDNGAGIPADLTLDNCKTLGLTLVRELTAQLQGTLLLERSEGTTILINFPLLA
ncbi:MAG: histidine kinase dimerization/phosphoacceptor domain -containing protein [Pseudomonadota bacterium]